VKPGVIALLPVLALVACGGPNSGTQIARIAKTWAHGATASCQHVTGNAWRCHITGVPRPYRIAAEFDQTASDRCYVIRHAHVRPARSPLPPCRDQ
jgi:hypothetical protein